jgi:hypothetical protein
VKIDAGITYFYFEQIFDSRKNKALRGSTLYKVTRPAILSLDTMEEGRTTNFAEL